MNAWQFPNIQVTWLASTRSEVQVHVCLPLRDAPWWMLLQHSIMLRLFFIACFLCATRVFDVWASSSSPRLCVCVQNFVSFVAPIAELARGEKLGTKSLNHSLTQLICASSSSSIESATSYEKTNAQCTCDLEKTIKTSAIQHQWDQNQIIMTKTDKWPARTRLCNSNNNINSM